VDRMKRIAGAEETGMTLVELIVAMGILSVVLTVFLTTFVSVQRAATSQDLLSQNNNNTRLALENMDRLVRSGNVLYDPASPSSNPHTTGCAAYQCFLVYTQANGTTAQPSSCVQWQMTSGGLETRSWQPAPAAFTPTPWRLVASGVLNQAVSPGLRTFEIDSDPLKGGRTVDVVFLVGVGGSSTSTSRVEASLTGRNTSYGYLTNACSNP
jgi:prepilin-type N-terminal cleavage/methylation domain-containing protein